LVADKLLLNDGTSNVLLNDGISVVLLNSETTDVGGVWDSMQEPTPTVVKPWMGDEKEEEEQYELLITASPIMDQLFKKDLTSIPLAVPRSFD